MQSRVERERVLAQPESMTPSLAEIMEQHVTLELESIDRLYLNGYVSGLQTPAAVAYFLRRHRGAQFASSVLLRRDQPRLRSAH